VLKFGRGFKRRGVGGEVQGNDLMTRVLDLRDLQSWSPTPVPTSLQDGLNRGKGNLEKMQKVPSYIQSPSPRNPPNLPYCSIRKADPSRQFNLS
jgi:hypothetical protein